MWQNAGDRWRNANLKSLGKPGPQFVPYFKTKLGRWDEQYGLLHTGASMGSAQIALQSSRVAPSIPLVVDAQTQRTYGDQLDQIHLGYPLTQDNLHVPFNVTTAGNTSFFSVPIGSCVVPASESNELMSASTSFRCINTLPEPLLNEMELMEEFVGRYHIVSEDHVGRSCLANSQYMPQVDGVLAFSQQATSTESMHEFSHGSIGPLVL
jgi:hypothetical protein